jgi:hypothetical protein
VREGFVPISYENVVKGRRYDFDLPGTFGLLADRVVLSEPQVYGDVLVFDATDLYFAQNIKLCPAYIREVRT